MAAGIAEMVAMVAELDDVAEIGDGQGHGLVLCTRGTSSPAALLQAVQTWSLAVVDAVQTVLGEIYEGCSQV